MTGWRFWIDRGGTFTDVVAADPDGDTHVCKLLSEAPDAYDDAAIEGIRRLLGVADGSIPVGTIASVTMGTTVATNALLERHGDATALVITRGFADALRIGYQNRPRLFDLAIHRPEPLYDHVVEVDERVAVDGTVLLRPRPEPLLADLRTARVSGCTSAAVVLMHGYRFNEHEDFVAELAREAGFGQVSTSHDCSALIKFVARGDTTVVDAYLSPILLRYTRRVAQELPGVDLRFMQSNGGLAQATAFRGKDAILSGPAGGLIGSVRTSRAAGFDRVVTFDMGGTSTDVAHFGGELERSLESEVAGVRLRAPMLDIHTVAAGGGSICSFDGSRLRVGPASAGAEPGPASYGKGGPLTVTDCNAVLGLVRPEFFPTTFGPGRDAPLDVTAALHRLEAVRRGLSESTGDTRSPAMLAEGFRNIAVANMANAIKKVSIARGHDVSAYALACFGGAGGQHACAVADELGISSVVIHPLAGVLSAVGMALADTRLLHERSVEVPLSDMTDAELAGLLTEAAGDVTNGLRQQGATGHIEVERHVHLKYVGSDTALPIPHSDSPTLLQDFAAAHHRRFGFTMPDRAVVIDAIAVEAIERSESAQLNLPIGAGAAAVPTAHVPVHLTGQTHDAPVFRRDDLPVGQRIRGPAIIAESVATTVVEPGWQASVLPGGELNLQRVEARPGTVSIGTSVDPVMLEVFNNLFMSVAERMGVTLQQTSRSVNIKERLDFSCAIFDPAGRLVANAPHIPVHLGSMGESVHAIIAEHRQSWQPGDVFATNDPFNGGTHLPDITVVTPVFGEEPDPLFFVASRGHHADVGGITPGSMPPMSRTIHEEGVLLRNIRIVREGVFDEPLVRRILEEAAYPARSPDRNVNDLVAQIAANANGVTELQGLVERFGLAVVRAYMGHVQDNAAECVRRVIDSLDDGHHVAHIDDGAPIEVRVSVDRAARRVVVDFAGTGPARSDNFNAPRAVTRAAVLYAFRCLVDDDIPLNDGCLDPVDLRVPADSLLDPGYPAAVVAGNVEISQVVTDALLAALGACAASQGTMNNLTFGTEDFQYYETICGGSGAGPDFTGTAAVQTHMTNSRLTDPEVLELRHPVRVRHFGVRAGTGGSGLRRGGDGAVRELEFLIPMRVSLLSGRRRVAPFGLHGGGDGAPGRTTLERLDGAVHEMAATESVLVEAGDRLVIETPGGGGFGGDGATDGPDVRSP
ncbi:MAG: hydantoinase B/oxoprolinase family protein [Candidatus Nanopelagicales bacterium]